jgi:hypothetical protein
VNELNIDNKPTSHGQNCESCGKEIIKGMVRVSDGNGCYGTRMTLNHYHIHCYLRMIQEKLGELNCLFDFNIRGEEDGSKTTTCCQA